jgi:hypothetical protein
LPESDLRELLIDVHADQFDTANMYEQERQKNSESPRDDVLDGSGHTGRGGLQRS